MATQTKNTTAPFDDMVERANEASEQFTAAARKAGTAYLDSYDKAVDRTIDLELKLAAATRQDWLKSLIETRVEFTRELAGTYTNAARTLLK
jgi:hypothetical protein